MKKTDTFNDYVHVENQLGNNLLVSKRFNIVDQATTAFFAACRFPQKAR